MNKTLIAAIGVLILAADSGSGQTTAVTSPSASEATALVKKALAIRKPGEVAAVIRPGTMTPDAVVDALQAIRKENGEPIGTAWLSSIDKNGMSLEGVEIAYAGNGKKVKRLAILTPDASGVWKMDFPAFVRLAEPSWKKLLAGGKATTGVVRVSVARDFYYNGPFQDEAEWAAYGMISPEMDELLVGYCKRSSDQCRAMELMWSHDETVVLRATLEIRRVEGGGRRQFEITRVLAEDWVIGERPFDETVKGLGSAPVIPPTTRKRMSNEELDEMDRQEAEQRRKDFQELQEKLRQRAKQRRKDIQDGKIIPMPTVPF